MASFNDVSYNPANVDYNMITPLFIDGSNCIPMSGNLYYNGLFGNVMCSFAVDNGDTVLGGNVIMYGDVSCCSRVCIRGNVYVGGDISFNGSNVTFASLPECSANPTKATNLVTKAYVDNLISNGGGTSLLTSINTWSNANTFSGDVSFNGKVRFNSDVSMNGNVTFASLPDCSANPTKATNLVTKAYVDNSISTGGGTSLLGFANIWTGNNKFTSDVSFNGAVKFNNDTSMNGNVTFAYLPTSSIMPTKPTELVTKTYVDTTISTGGGASLLNISNIWTGYNKFTGDVSFNGNVKFNKDVSMNGNVGFAFLPYSTATPAKASDLVTKTYVDSAIVSSGGTSILGTVNTWSTYNKFTSDVSFNGKVAFNSDISLNGTVTFASLPTTSATPTTNNQLVTKLYADTKTTLSAVQANNNTFTNTNIFTGSTSLATTTASSLNVTSGSIAMLASGFNSIYFTDVVGAFTTSVNNYCRMFTVNSIAYIDFYGSRIWRNVGSTAGGGNDVVMTLSSTGNLTIAGKLISKLPIETDSTYKNVGLGYQVFNNGLANCGTANVAIGYQAAYAVQSSGNSGNNVYIGYQSGFNSSYGIYNTYIGYQSGGGAGTVQGVANGFFNSCVGALAGSILTSGQENAFFGNQTGTSITTGSYNTFIGSRAGSTSNVSNSVAIGYNTKCDADNQIMLGKTTQTVVVPGKLNVTTRPYSIYISNAVGVNAYMSAGYNFGTYDGGNAYLIWNQITTYGGATVNEVPSSTADWNKFTGTFTAPSNGLYHFQLGIFINETTRYSRWLQAAGTGVMGTSQYLNFNQSYLTSEGSFTTSLMYYMTTGQTFYLYCPAQTPICFFGNGHTCLQIIKI